MDGELVSVGTLPVLHEGLLFCFLTFVVESCHRTEGAHAAGEVAAGGAALCPSSGLAAVPPPMALLRPSQL